MARKNRETSIEISPLVRPMPQINPILDSFCGVYSKGIYGDNLMSGAGTPLILMAGKGNTFKTAFTLQLMVELFRCYLGSTICVYDTEMTFKWTRIFKLLATMGYDVEDLLEEGRILLTDKELYTGDAWWDIIKARCDERRAKRAKSGQVTPFLNHGDIPVKVMPYELWFLDSLTEFEAESIEELHDKGSIDDKDQTVDYLKGNLFKARMLKQVQRYLHRGDMRLICSAHVTNQFSMEKFGPDTQQLATIPKDFKFNSVPNGASFLSDNTYFIRHAKPLTNDTTKASEYPVDGYNKLVGDTDLMELSIINARSKSGPTGHRFNMVASQEYGIIPDLSNYHYLNSRRETGTTSVFGFTEKIGHARALELHPECKMQRTNVRKILDEDPKAVRALQISVEQSIMNDYWFGLNDKYKVTSEELRAKLIEKGYDMDLILGSRRFWTFDHYSDETTAKFGAPLSTMDLLEMIHDEYVPWWYPNKDALKVKGELKDTRILS